MTDTTRPVSSSAVTVTLPGAAKRSAQVAQSRVVIELDSAVAPTLQLSHGFPFLRFTAEMIIDKRRISDLTCGGKKTKSSPRVRVSVSPRLLP